MQTDRPELGAPTATTAEDALMRLMMVAGRRFRSRIDGDTVDPAQATLLFALKSHGPLRLGDIAEALKLDASTVSRHVHQLGDRGFIVSEPDPEDGRARIIALSEAGETSLRKTFDQRREFITVALTDWSDADRDRLRTDLIRLTTSLGAPS